VNGAPTSGGGLHALGATGVAAGGRAGSVRPVAGRSRRSKSDGVAQRAADRNEVAGVLRRPRAVKRLPLTQFLLRRPIIGEEQSSPIRVSPDAAGRSGRPGGSGRL